MIRDREGDWASLTTEERRVILKRLDKEAYVGLCRMMEGIPESPPTDKEDSKKYWMKMSRDICKKSRGYCFLGWDDESIRATRAIPDLFREIVSHRWDKASSADVRALTNTLTDKQQISFFVGLSTYCGIPCIPDGICQYISSQVKDGVRKELMTYDKI